VAYVGFLALGLFVGCVAVLGFKQAANDFAKGGTAILSAALGGVAIAYSDKLSPVSSDPRSIFMYPIGLLVAIPWFYMPNILEFGLGAGSSTGSVTTPPSTRHRVLMGLAIIGTVLVTLLATLLAFVPAFRGWVDRT
jgi:hypothetical protein